MPESQVGTNSRIDEKQHLPIKKKNGVIISNNIAALEISFNVKASQIATSQTVLRR